MRSGQRNSPIGSPAVIRASEAATATPGRRGSFTDVPTTTSHPPRAAAPRRRRGAAALAATASLLVPLMTAAPALADPTASPSPSRPSVSPSPSGAGGRAALPANGGPGTREDDGKGIGRGAPRRPPARMSTVGGELLGRPGPQVQPGPGAPPLPTELSGRSWLVADAESGEILAANNAHWELPPASTLKMLFADTVLPKLPRTKTHKVTPADLEGMGAGSSAVGVKEGSTYSVHDLWLGVFLRSGNDAVRVLASMNGGIQKTVKDMQAHAEELQALDTHVVTPDGYDADQQVSSAYDLTLFARSGLQKADFREYCSTVSAQFPGEEQPGKKRESFAIVNTNRLLTGEGMEHGPYKGMAGVKNGSTTNAGNTFTGVAQHDGRKLLVTVMNPDIQEPHEVYKETERLLDWGFEAAGRVKPVGMLVPPKGVAGNGKGGGQTGGDHAQASVAGSGSGGMWTAVGIAGGSLVALGAGAFLVHRRWPRPKV
ncbi:D-alanyl-D-alanine carboxypeptidase family protein [Streptomyces sp. URMC 127]|uniref:D-alanyl-D-alanine carboxypeptidase family protein n=1 Tax=Streptomyces sp. URMC 127 TaxID=3423402 RepID=UPI003F1C819E